MRVNPGQGDVATDEPTTERTAPTPARPPRQPARGLRAHARDPRLRGAGGRALPRRRGPRLRPPVDRAGGDRGRAPAGRWARPTSSPRPTGATATAWPRACDPAGMFAELMGKDQGTTGAAAARCTSPTRRSGSSGPTASWRPGVPIAVGAATAAQLRRQRQRRRGVLRRRRRRAGRLPRGGEPRRRVEAARWSSSARTTGMPSSRPASTQHAASARAPGRRLRHPLRRRRRQRRRGRRRR